LKKESDQAKFHLIERNHELAVLRKTIEMYKSPHSSGKPIEELINQLLSTSSLKQRGNTSLWNLEKKEQKKMELLREKLKENILKVEELSSYNMQLKENLNRNEKDRLRIMTELQSIKAKPSTPALENAHINEIKKLNGKVQTLQAALVKASDHSKTTQAKDVVNHDHLTLFDKKNADLQKKEYADSQKKVQDMILELKKEQNTATTHITKLSDENQKLRSRLKKEGEKSESIVKQLLSLSVEIDGYKSEISLLKGTIRAYSRESINEDKNETIRNLKKELDEKDRAIYELMTTEGSSGKVVSENRKLRREMEVMEMRVEKLSHLPINLLNA
jgi:chromosome segregation ATPase